LASGSGPMRIWISAIVYLRPSAMAFDPFL
jgi:hypothetical protein